MNEILNLAKAVFKDMKHSKQVVSFANKILARKDQFELFMEMLSIILEDILMKLCKKDNLITLKTQVSFYNDISNDYTVKSVCEIEKLIRKVIEEKSFNVNLSAMVDNLLLGILEVKYLCK